ncbi:hypothetical protein FHS18_001158 [Paenibacillus phyllosphaerae]|uniref:Uncharacterized protein n=1 Tax=Paenibacillus phyllosphaerae TaxID=274593 RepID=A0A7W5FLF2_9BACL|nr:hypothetical protein [Paenibacillus phyllosphaerae]MBB3109106.1 hypothetical protein [Paenibacillus phyllosphaerae]
MSKWDNRQEVSDVLLAFPADVTHLPQTWGEIPEELKKGSEYHKNWHQLARENWMMSLRQT